ncbi:hypothetical protein [Streptomyces sp. NPDC052042]|uniref:hypothetical protein n=1 Tax=Streptomyces sp. NPDC052042 TaxID=3365683 RepID=UPI0037CCCEFF
MSGPMSLEPDDGREDTLALRLARAHGPARGREAARTGGPVRGGTGTRHDGGRRAGHRGTVEERAAGRPREDGLALRPGQLPSPTAGPGADGGRNGMNAGPVPAEDMPPALRLPRVPHPAQRSRTDAPVDRLAAELAEQIGPAVHAYEVAAVLESEGLTSDVIQHKYGHPDLFSLAADLYGRVPRSFPEPPAPPDPWTPDHVRCALRGALFALPALAYPLVPRMWHGHRDTLALIAAGLLSWAWGQALGHRTYLRLATGPREAGRTMLVGAPAGAVLASATGLAVAGPGTAAVLAVGQSCYLAAAGVLLVLGRERLLLCALLPLVPGAGLLFWWEPGPLPRIGIPLLTLVSAMAAAGQVIREKLKAPPVPGTPCPLVRSVPYGLFGLAAGVLVAFSARQGHTLSIVVLTLSMGSAEWLLYRFRGLSVSALRATGTMRGFRLRSAAVLALCLLCYLLPLIPGALLTGADPVALAALGATLWTALLLQAFGIAWLPAGICATAAAGVAVVHLLDAPDGPLALRLYCGAAAIALAVCALRSLGRPTAHV